MLNYLKRRILGLTVMRGIRRSRALAKVRPVNMTEGFTLTTFDWVFTPTWEASERREMARMMQNCDLFVDIGANHGFYTLLALHLGKPAIAIEPEAVNLSILRKNVGHKAKVIPAAVSDFCGNLTIYGDGDMASISSAWQGTARHFRQKVPAITLDSIETWPGKLFIKVDVEGAEDAVLRGATETLKRDAVWLIETLPELPRGGINPAYKNVMNIMKDWRKTETSPGNFIFER